MIQHYSNPYLKSLEDLGAITNNGIFELKPFRDWVGTPWQHRIFSMRLCNAGELIDIFNYLQDFPQSSRDYVLILETIIRSVWKIEGQVLVTREELQEYNNQAGTDFSELSYLRMWVKNLEQPVVERLNAVYSSLQTKQVRQLIGVKLCGSCGTTYATTSLGNHKVLKYSLAEIICENCIPNINSSNYDFVEEKVEQKTETFTESSLKAKSENVHQLPDLDSFICSECNKTFLTIEELSSHRLVCENG